MDVFRMKCFISVAKHENMSEAAREMLITRPAMTAQMNALEAEMGATLLLRDKKGTRLTPAGKRALETFETVVASLDELDSQVRRIDRKTKARLRIGYHGPAEWEGLGNLLAQFRTSFPDVEVEVAQLPWNALTKSVEDGTLDAALVELSDARENGSLSTRALFDDGLCAIVRRDDPLAERTSIGAEELAGTAVFLPSSSVGPRYFRNLVKALRGMGVNVHETGFGNVSEATIVLAEAGYGVAVMPRSFKQALKNAVFVDIESDGLAARMGIAWRTDSKNPTLSTFRHLCETWAWK